MTTHCDKTRQKERPQALTVAGTHILAGGTFAAQEERVVLVSLIHDYEKDEKREKKRTIRTPPVSFKQTTQNFALQPANPPISTRRLVLASLIWEEVELV